MSKNFLPFSQNIHHGQNLGQMKQKCRCITETDQNLKISNIKTQPIMDTLPAFMKKQIEKEI